MQKKKGKIKGQSLFQQIDTLPQPSAYRNLEFKKRNAPCI